MPDTTPLPAPAGWLEALARSEAELAAGQTVSLASVLERLRADADQLEAELGLAPTSEAEPVVGASNP